MIPTETQLRRVADDLVDQLLRGDFLDLRSDSGDNRGTLRERFFVALRDDFAREARLEDEAEAFADSHRRDMSGMDRGKVVELVKQRLAKERGIVL